LGYDNQQRSYLKCGISKLAWKLERTKPLLEDLLDPLLNKEMAVSVYCVLGHK
jgi:hypothetical protein